jgi:hypothetical protein
MCDLRDEYGVVSGPRGERRIVGRHDELVEAQRHVNLLYEILDELWAAGIREWQTERATDNCTNWDRQIARRHGEEPPPIIIHRRVTEWTPVP